MAGIAVGSHGGALLRVLSRMGDFFLLEKHPTAMKVGSRGQGGFNPAGLQSIGRVLDRPFQIVFSPLMLAERLWRMQQGDTAQQPGMVRVFRLIDGRVQQRDRLVHLRLLLPGKKTAGGR